MRGYLKTQALNKNEVLVFSTRFASQLSLQDTPPGQYAFRRRPHAQLARDGRGLVQQGHRLLSVTRLVPLQQGVGVVAAGPGQFGAIIGVSAEAPGVSKMFRRLVVVADSVREKTSDRALELKLKHLEDIVLSRIWSRRLRGLNNSYSGNKPSWGNSS